MLRITRSANERVVFTLSGRIQKDDVAELARLLGLETVERHIVLNLKDVTLVDRDAVKFLERCETEGMQLQNCPAYIREWINRQSGKALGERAAP